MDTVYGPGPEDDRDESEIPEDEQGKINGGGR